ncbi:MAG: SpoVG family protein [Calditrichaeota bacterium]|nr:SpoVG family protein [Candidatus Cloacimonadota bacterium]MCA9786697.1 SpoVG family protein [Candidatus Cloacimonadota bacterium]MCB1047358.1 SpoVG family protein [Calditrichota bacterium]
MDITEVNITLRDDDKLRAFVNITFDDVFVIRGLKIIQGTRGLFVCMPSRRMDDGSHKDIAHPISNEFRQLIEDRVLREYHLHENGNSRTASIMADSGS